MGTKFLRKISVGTINGVRGGLRIFKDEDIGTGRRERVMTIIGVAHSYKEHVSETMGISYGFAGEFRAINKDGVESIAPIAFLVEPAQSTLVSALKDEKRVGGVRFGFHFDAVEDETAIKGYRFECEPMLAPQASNELAELAQQIGYESPQGDLKLGHDGGAAADEVAEETPDAKEIANAAKDERTGGGRTPANKKHK